MILGVICFALGLFCGFVILCAIIDESSKVIVPETHDAWVAMN